METPHLDDWLKRRKASTPGGQLAIAYGCTCPVLDNAHGAGSNGEYYWITEGCPLHDKGSGLEEV